MPSRRGDGTCTTPAWPAAGHISSRARSKATGCPRRASRGGVTVYRTIIVLIAATVGRSRPARIRVPVKTSQSSESIFEVANNTNDNAGTDSYAYLSSQSGYGELLGTRQTMNSKSTGTTLSTFKGLYDCYSNTDVRRNFLSLGNRNSLGGEVNVPLCTKYINISTNMENIKVIRLSEMYLSRAEAMARLAVKNSDANSLTSSLVDINLIRKLRDTASATKAFTASILAVPPMGVIKATALLDSIIVERRKEFALEGHRIFDLNRTKTDYVKINAAGNSASRLIQYTATTSSYYYRTILPIPVTQVQNNPKMVQNPGF
jgi:hypothetical protein